MTIMTNKCLRCDYEWQPRVSNPKQCSRCKSFLWDTPRTPEVDPQQPETKKTVRSTFLERRSLQGHILRKKGEQ